MALSLAKTVDLSRQILHDLELELHSDPGTMEHNWTLQERVAQTLREYNADAPDECNCGCKLCILAHA